MKKAFLPLFWHIVLATAFSYVFLVIFALIVAAVLSSVEAMWVRELLLAAMMSVVYAFFFKRLHLTPRLYTYHRHAGTYDFKSELRAFFTTDGKALLIIYGACALLCEISHLFPVEIIHRFSLVCIPFFTPYILLSDIPVLRSLLSFLFAVALMALLVARHGKRQFTKELHPQGPEQPTAPIVVQPRWRK